MSDEPGPLAGLIEIALTDSASLQEINESTLTYQEIDRSSDRVCAIVAAAWIEGRLRNTLSHRLREHPYLKSVFAHEGMLGAYEPKVVMGYLLGIYGEEARDSLLAIGSIRNRFAHRTYIRTFDHRELDSFFKKLTIYRRLETTKIGLRGLFPDALPKHARHRERFLASAKTLEAYLLLDPFNGPPIVPHTPRF